MAILQRRNGCFRPGQSSSEQIGNYPLPADQKIVGGIALIGAVRTADLERVQARLQEAFGIMCEDTSTQAGDCIAYGHHLGLTDVEEVDELLLATAKQQNHGMLTQQTLNDTHTLWVGRALNREFILNKSAGPLLLSDDTFTQGVVYSLLSGRARQL